MFNWEINKWENNDYWMVKAGDDYEIGKNGALKKGTTSKDRVVNIIGVLYLDETAEKIKQKGGKVPSPKMAISNVGRFAYCEDTKGNAF